MNRLLKLVPLFALLLISQAMITSCDDNDNDVDPPVITLTELGLENSREVYVGSDLHVEAEIVAEATIKEVKIEMHLEGEHDHEEEGEDHDHEHEEHIDELEVIFDEFAGLKNTTFHKHIDIPSNMEEGEYHFHFVVTDMDGNQTEVDGDLLVKEIEDEVAPELTITTAPTSGQTFSNGETISIAGTATDNIALAGMMIGLVRTEDAIADADVDDENPAVIVLLHTHEFEDHESHNFTSSIVVGATEDNNETPGAIDGANAWQTGDYYILVKVKDAKGNWTYSAHYDLKVSL